VFVRVCICLHVCVHMCVCMPFTSPCIRAKYMVIKFNLSHVASKFPSSLCTQARGTTNPHSCSYHHHLLLCPIPNLYQQHIPFPPSPPRTQALCALPLTARLPLPRSIPVLPSPPLACTVSLPYPPTFCILILRTSAQQQQQGHRTWGCAAAQQQSHTTQEGRGCAG
jgi:hypothetical protein